MAGSAPVARTQVRGGGTAVVVLPTLPLGQTLSNAGSVNLPGLQTSIPLTGNPTVVPGLGFRPDVALPSLPQSAITPVQPAAIHEAAIFLEALGPDMGRDRAFKPGPGADLPPMQQQAVLMAAKQVAVTAELKTLSGSQNVSDESSGALGQRLMDILIGNRPAGSGPSGLLPDAPLSEGGVGAGSFDPMAFSPSMKSGISGLRPSLSGGGPTERSSRPDEVPGLGVSLIGTDAASFSLQTSAPRSLPLPIPLLTLRVSRQVLSLSYAVLPGQRRIVTLAGTAAKQLSLALMGSPSASEVELEVPFVVRPRTAKAPTALQPKSGEALLESKTTAVPETAVEGASFAFLQQAGESLAAQSDRISGPSAAAWQKASPAKPSFPSSVPFLVVSFLPILGMALLLRGARI